MRAQAEWKVISHMPARAVAEQLLDAPAHLLGGLVGERDRQDLARLRLVGEDQVRDPVREHPRLAAAGAREDQQRPLAVGDRLPLGLVEALEQLLEVLGVGALEHQPQHSCARRRVNVRDMRLARRHCPHRRCCARSRARAYV